MGNTSLHYFMNEHPCILHYSTWLDLSCWQLTHVIWAFSHMPFGSGGEVINQPFRSDNLFACVMIKFHFWGSELNFCKVFQWLLFLSVQRLFLYEELIHCSLENISAWMVVKMNWPLKNAHKQSIRFWF